MKGGPGFGTRALPQAWYQHCHKYVYLTHSRMRMVDTNDGGSRFINQYPGRFFYVSFQNWHAAFYMWVQLKCVASNHTAWPIVWLHRNVPNKEIEECAFNTFFPRRYYFPQRCIIDPHAIWYKSAWSVDTAMNLFTQHFVRTQSTCYLHCRLQGPRLLACLNFNPSMDK